MKFPLSTTALTTSIALSLVTLAPVFASQPSDEKDNDNIEQSVGLGAGSIIGGIVAGPVGIVTGALIGSLIGQDIANENQKQHLIHINDELNNKLNNSSEKLVDLEDDSASQATILRDAHLTIERLLTQNQELKNHALNFDVQFRTNSSIIEKQYQQYLIDLAGALNETPNMELEVAGFADRTGDEDYNLDLSIKRAQQVKDFLVQQGIEEDRITTLAHGETQPLHSEESLENNFFDRRVSIYLRPFEHSTKNIADEIVTTESELSVAANRK